MKKFVSILLVAFIAVWSVSCGALEERRKEKNLAKDEATVDTTTVVVKEEPKTDSASSNTVVVVSEENESTTDTNNKTTVTKKYYVIVGSFVKKQNAESLYSELSKGGTPSELLDGNGSFTRVSKKAFDTKEEAMKELERVRKMEKKADAWILTADSK